MKILVIGSGGREHALVWKIAQSPQVSKIYAAPGNPGMATLAECVPISADDVAGLLDFALKNQIDLTVVGPDNTLALGLTDVFQAKGLAVFAPTRAAAMIESSKVFAKRLMTRSDIPTAPYEVFEDYRRALDFLSLQDMPVVIKASGLASGKGAHLCFTPEQAKRDLKDIMVGKIHGQAGRQVIIESYIAGQEVSIHAFCDGKSFQLFPPAQDHKSILPAGQGKNTGGMGTVAPITWLAPRDWRKIQEQMVKPVLDHLAKAGTPFIGCLYPGLKMTPNGPIVLEYNARFGDPETQSYMRLLKTDLVEIMQACLSGKLSEIEIEWQRDFAACLVLASGGYPDNYKKGYPITGLKEAEKIPGVIIFQAGTEFTDRLVTAGGRVLGLTATGLTLKEALDKAYEAAKLIHFQDMYFRPDIGYLALQT